MSEIKTAIKTLEGHPLEDTGARTLISELSENVVSSINGQQGAVVLNATDVHALPDTTVIPTAYTLPTASAAVKGGVKVGDGLVMDGETLAVKPDKALTLMESITIGDEDTELLEIIRDSYSGLKQLRINCTTPAQEVAQNIFVTTNMGVSAMTIGGRAYYGQNLTGDAIFKMRRNAGYWDGETEIGGASSNSTKYGQVGTEMIDVATHPEITKIRIYTFSPGFSAGTKFEIYGVIEDA